VLHTTDHPRVAPLSSPTTSAGCTEPVGHLTSTRTVLIEPVPLVTVPDTVVTLDRSILGKPAGAEEARRMLESLSGRVHEVWTGLFLFDPAHDRGVGEAVRSIVKFSRLEADEIDRYVATGEPLDKAGAYAVQGYGAAFVEAIEGSYTNVVGLPLGHLRHLLRLARGDGSEAD